MNSVRRAPHLLLALFVVACGSAINWTAACGCHPLWVMVANDLGLPESIGEQTVTPDFLAAQTLQKLEGHPLNLETLRSIGPYFNAMCATRVWNEIRCTFWMWTFEDRRRGIELQFQEGVSDGLLRAVKGRYVYTSDDPEHG